MQQPTRPLPITLALTTIAMLAFAANSILCRFALTDGDADAGTFTLIRLVSGACVLVVICIVRSGASGYRSGTWPSAAALGAYALGFSIAYRQLESGTGALILFAAVQATMIGWGIWCGERPRLRAWLGMVIAAAGAAWLLLPGASAPAPLGAILMAIAGIGWGIYSLRGKSASNPIAATAGNFVRASVLVLPIAMWFIAHMPTTKGWLAAMTSGAFTSGLGYVIWYAALPHLRATSASVVQLTVPAITAIAGVVLLGELLTLRLVLASIGILGGVLLVVLSRERKR